MYKYIELGPKKFMVVRKAIGHPRKSIKVCDCPSESMALQICEAMEKE